ncbi:MAG TPA: PAS domain S-box protein [Chromatiales bacterium]|nr:PAS domain S-box protein [Chromatiales bacterium]
MKLRFKLLLPIIASLGAFAIFLFGYWEPILIEKERSLVINGEKHVLASLEAGLARSLLAGDLAEIQATLDHQMQLHSYDWISLTLIDSENRQLYKKNKEEKSAAEEGMHIFFEQPVRWNSTQLARLQLTINIEAEMGAIDKHIDSLNHSIALFFLLMMSSIYLLQDTIFRKPLTRLQHAITSLEKGNFDCELPVRKSADEIGSLTDAFKNMHSALMLSKREQEEALQTARESEARYKSVIENVIDGIVLIDTEGTIISCNSKLLKIFGFYEEELIGHKVNLLMPPDESAVHDHHLSRYVETGKAKIIGVGRELKGRRKDGSTFPIDLGISEINEHGKQQFVGVIRDITERKKIELTLIESREQAEAALKAKSEFLAMMSHELRTPLNGVIGMVQLMRDSGLNEEQLEQLGVINDSSHALLTIIDEILDLTKIEGGRLTIKSEPFNIEALIDAIQTLLAPQAAEKGLKFSAKLESDCSRAVVGDAGRVRQVLLNLIGNAIKFTEKGSVSLEATCRQVNANEIALHILIIDSGIGISDEDQAMLFQVFSQIDSSSTRRYGGTGLGLAISKQLIDLMGGEIGMQSNPDGGSTFWITLTLPLADQGADNCA